MKGRRTIKSDERNQRGCQFCLDAGYHGSTGPHRVCPYTEMDGFSKYKDYLKASGGASVPQLLKNIGGTGGGHSV